MICVGMSLCVSIRAMRAKFLSGPGFLRTPREDNTRSMHKSVFVSPTSSHANVNSPASFPSVAARLTEERATRVDAVRFAVKLRAVLTWEIKWRT